MNNGNGFEDVLDALTSVMELYSSVNPPDFITHYNLK